MVGGTWAVVAANPGPDCRGQARLRVGAAAQIAPAVQAAADRWTVDGAEVNGLCVAVQVVQADPAEVAGAIAARHGVILDSLGAPSGVASVPDVWIPDSSTWPARLAAAIDGFPPTADPVAQSPVVLAMPEPVARRLGWPGNQINWQTVVGQLAVDDPLSLGVVEPSRDAASLSGLLALARAGGDAASAGPAMARAMRALAQGRASDPATLLKRLTAAAGDPRPGIGAAPLAEHQVIGYNAANPSTPLAAVYPQPAAGALDYPYVVPQGIDPIRAGAAQGLRRALAGATFSKALGRVGLRSADGATPVGFITPTAAPTKPALAAGGAGQAAAIDRVLATWTAVTQPARMLTVFDMSGSMLQAVPSAGGATRSEVTAEAARRGLALFDDSSSIGTWMFSTNLDGSRDYLSVLPVRQLDDAHRAAAAKAIDGLRPNDGGGTGLYDTTLAAYRTMIEDWQPGRINSVVVFTDGRDEDANGLELSELLRQLRRLADPDRPVLITMIGIGRDADQSALRRISDATGGSTFVTDDPAKIGEIFLRAMAQRASARPAG
ncbi:substrate-binding domain-containing protein [Pilimelia columellifera subsp. columellifera]|uniref:Substrate-binding domain-containing protein n=1 Tax=Pilimelia columellifera subsp. columellifera TaxID=706583 RepID=A0ABN3NUD0_9ACTN